MIEVLASYYILTLEGLDGAFFYGTLIVKIVFKYLVLCS